MVWPLHVFAASPMHRCHSRDFFFFLVFFPVVNPLLLLLFFLSEANAQGRFRVRLCSRKPSTVTDFSPLLPALGGRRLFRLWHHEERLWFSIYIVHYLNICTIHSFSVQQVHSERATRYETTFLIWCLDPKYKVWLFLGKNWEIHSYKIINYILRTKNTVHTWQSRKTTLTL